MSVIIRFNVSTPSTLSEAFRIMFEEGGNAVPMAGGTDLIVMIRSGVIKPKKVLDLWGLRRELSFIRLGNGFVSIGALTTIKELSESSLVREGRYAGFSDMVKSFATPYIRSLATVGGNIGAAHPLSDAAILLLTLNAEVKLSSVNGSRWVKLNELFKGKRVLAKEPYELITEVRFRETPKNSSTALIKFDRRWGHAMGYVVAAAYLELSNGRVKNVRIAFDSMGKPYPERAYMTEEFLKGRELSDEVLEKACEEVLPKEMRRISDYRASAWYRLELSKVLMRRALLKAKSRIEGGSHA